MKAKKTTSQVLIDLEDLIKNVFKLNINYEISNKNELDHGYYYHNNQILIRKCRDFRIGSLDLICILAHELGHHIDYSIRNPEPAHVAYDQLWNPPEGDAKNISRKNKHEIYNREVAAWDYAKRVLNNLGFSYWEAFSEKREYCLNSYLTTLGLR